MSGADRLQLADDLERHGHDVPTEDYIEAQADTIKEARSLLQDVPRDASDPLYDILEELAIVLETIEQERRDTTDLTEAELREALHVEVTYP